MDGAAIEFELGVWAPKVRELALALGERNPLCLDPTAARRAGFAERVAPPTFPVLQAWEYELSDLQGIGPRLDYRRALHAEQSFAYERPLVVGETLAGRCECTGVRRASGRSGEMTFVTYRTTYRDAARATVATSDYVLVELEARPDPAAQAAASEPEPAPADHVTELGPVGRRDFARYAGAVGDFNPMHVDEAKALAAGEPSVFAAGMMTAGLLASAAGSWAEGPATLSRFSVRLAARVWPGDLLRCEGTRVPGGGLDLRVRRRAAAAAADTEDAGAWQTAVTGSCEHRLADAAQLELESAGA